MAKKKKQESKVTLSNEGLHPLQGVYMLLAMNGVIHERGDLVAPYDDYGQHLSVAIPSIKYGIALPGDITEKLEDNGWHIEHIAVSDLEPFGRVFFAVDNARVAKTYANADPNVKTTSKPEEKIFSEIVRRRLPVPDRNYRINRENGTELTTPDFTWEDERVAFFMDGSYWHSIKQDEDMIKAIKKSRKLSSDIVNTRKDKVKKDGAIRTELAADGWIVLSCTDEDIEDQDGLMEKVDLIEKTLHRVWQSKKTGVSSEKESSLMDEILSSEE